jgi:hypothetical protein
MADFGMPIADWAAGRAPFSPELAITTQSAIRNPQSEM